MGEAGDGGTLGFESKAALALAVGRNPINRPKTHSSGAIVLC